MCTKREGRLVARAHVCLRSSNPSVSVCIAHSPGGPRGSLSPSTDSPPGVGPLRGVTLRKRPNSPLGMWGRANMAAVTLLFLLGWICIFAEGAQSNGPKTRNEKVPEAQSSHGDVEAMLERATSWLWAQRDKAAGWGNDTHMVLLALRLANLSRDDDVPTPVNLEMQLSTKQMELEIILLLWRHREVGSSPVRLARYTLALNAMCMEPRQFHGHDLIGILQHHEPASDYEFALTALAACNAQAHVRKRQMRRLLDIAHAAQDQNFETVAMGIMTLQCIVQDHRHRNLQHYVLKPSVNLAQLQRRDGSFGDLRTTILALQALNWNRTTALNWLARRQRSDGSFDGDLKLTAEAVLSIAPRRISSIRTLDCGQGFSDSAPPRISTLNTGETAIPPSNHNIVTTVLPVTVKTESSPSSSNVSKSTSTSVKSTTSSTPILIGKQLQMVNVTYTLWVGSDVNEIHNLTLTAPKNETFYEVMVLAAQRSSNFQFSAYEWPNGHYVHTLAGYKEEPMSYHYWLLYRLPSPPEPGSPPGNQFVAPGGVDDLQISNGEHYLFWYKKL